MSNVKSHGSSVERHLKLRGLRVGEEGGILGVAVKCVDIERNAGSEGDLLEHF